MAAARREGPSVGYRSRVNAGDVARPWAGTVGSLAVFAVAVALGFIIVLPSGSPASVAFSLGIEIMATIVVATVAEWMPSPSRVVWGLLAANLALVTVGDVVYDVMQYHFGVEPFPSWPDILYFAAYLPQAAALVVIIARRQQVWDVAAWIDTAVATAAAFLIGAPIVFVPLAAAASDPASVVAALYPALDLLMLALLARIMFAGGRPTPALVLLTAGVGASLLADLVYNALAVAANLDEIPTWVDAAFAASTALIAFAVVAPGARTVAQPLRHGAAMITPARLLALGVGTLVGPVILVFQARNGDHPDMALIASVTVVINVLLLGRVLLLLRTVRAQESRLDALARTDVLTGLPNRRSWDFTLTRAAALVSSDGGRVVVAVGDLDGFKEFNDEFGHSAGDDLLAACAVAWRAALPDSAFLARYGGEEFAVLFTGMTVDEAASALERMRAATPSPATVSVGVSAAMPYEPLQRAFERADAALYQAKSDGRDRLVVHYAGTSLPG